MCAYSVALCLNNAVVDTHTPKRIKVCVSTRFLMTTNNDETESIYLEMKPVREMFLREVERDHVCLHLVL